MQLLSKRFRRMLLQPRNWDSLIAYALNWRSEVPCDLALCQRSQMLLWMPRGTLIEALPCRLLRHCYPALFAPTRCTMQLVK